MMEINHLPGEMLMKVFRMLPPPDLKMVVLVSRKWRTSGENPGLWKLCKVTVSNSDDINNLAIARLRDIQEICVSPRIRAEVNWQKSDWEAMFHAAIRLHKLKKIDGLNRKYLSSVEPALFARALTRLEVVELDGDTDITNDQVQALFASMCQNSRLKTLDLCGIPLSSVEPALFASAVTRVEDMDISSTDITNDQKQALFAAMCQNSQLKKLELRNIDLSSVEPEMFARGMARLEDVDLSETEITNDQIDALFAEMYRSSRIKKLDLTDSDLSSVKPDILATAVTRLEEVDLLDTELSTEQLTSILTHVQRVTKLKYLCLLGNNTAGLDPGVVRLAKKRLGHRLQI